MKGPAEVLNEASTRELVLTIGSSAALFVVVDAVWQRALVSIMGAMGPYLALMAYIERLPPPPQYPPRRDPAGLHVPDPASSVPTASQGTSAAAQMALWGQPSSHASGDPLVYADGDGTPVAAPPAAVALPPLANPRLTSLADALSLTDIVAMTEGDQPTRRLLIEAGIHWLAIEERDQLRADCWNDLLISTISASDMTGLVRQMLRSLAPSVDVRAKKPSEQHLYLQEQEDILNQTLGGCLFANSATAQNGYANASDALQDARQTGQLAIFRTIRPYQFSKVRTLDMTSTDYNPRLLHTFTIPPELIRAYFG